MRNPCRRARPRDDSRALGYVRVSTNQQAQEVVSLEAQQTRTARTASAQRSSWSTSSSTTVSGRGGWGHSKRPRSKS